MHINSKIKAFTLTELLVSMALSSVLVAFSFMGYSQMQKIFLDYSEQSQFINDYNQLNSALQVFSRKATIISKQNEQCIEFKTDSSSVVMETTDKQVILKMKNNTDTFNITINKTDITYQHMNDSLTTRLITSYLGTVYFKNQKFRISFHKQYDSESLLNTMLPRKKQ